MPTTLLTGMDTLARWRSVQFANRLYLTNGRNRPMVTNGLTARPAGVSRHTFTPVATPAGSGTMTGGPWLYVVSPVISTEFTRSGKVICGNPSSLSNAATASGRAKVTISGIPAAYDPDDNTTNSAVDKWFIYRTFSNGYISGAPLGDQQFQYVGQVAMGVTTFDDTLLDESLPLSDGARFIQLPPPAARFISTYNNRNFMAGFTPLTDGIVTGLAANLTVTFNIAKPDGMIGALLKFAGTDGLYRLTAKVSATQWTLNRQPPVTAGSEYSLFRNPKEICFTAFDEPEACGPADEDLRFRRELPREEDVTGLLPFQGRLLIFTPSNVWAIEGQGADELDVVLRQDPIVADLGCIAPETLCRVENEVWFLSQHGVGRITADGSHDLVGRNINTDWFKSLPQSSRELIVMNGNRKYVWIWYPESEDDTVAKKGYRFNKFRNQWESGERGLRPRFGVVEPVMSGSEHPGRVLFADGEQTVEMDAQEGYDNVGEHYGTITSADSDSAVLSISPSLVDGEHKGWPLHLIRGGVYTGCVRVNSHTTGATPTVDFTLSGNDPSPTAGDVVLLGTIPWHWTTKTFEIADSDIQAWVMRVKADNVPSGSPSLIKTDYLNGELDGTPLPITVENAATREMKWPVAATGGDYAAKVEVQYPAATLRLRNLSLVASAEVSSGGGAHP